VNTVGLIALVHGMRAYLARPEMVALIPKMPTVTALGWRQREQQLNQGMGQANRITLYPGLEPSGAYGQGGDLTRENRPSTVNPRALVTWRKPVTMSVWAVDTSSNYDEELQIAAAEQLLEYAVQAAHNAIDPATGTPVGVANLEWGSVRYTKPPVNMGFGAEILVEFMQKCPLFDRTVDIATPKPGLNKGPIT